MIADDDKMNSTNGSKDPACCYPRYQIPNAIEDASTEDPISPISVVFLS